MKSLDTLLKIAQRRMDELGVEATRIALAIGELEGKIVSLKAREDNEIALASKDMELASLLPAYRLRVRWQTDQIRAQVSEAASQLAEIRQRLNAAYQEKSKFEQLIEQEALRRTAERAAKEQAQLDEVAINRAGTFGK
ncbi:MAG: flagellar FliJ family protein [Hyphomonadaceae bacterium]|nr:flagellar FliJ family protein [Hyphomonadaceae bacterium]